jgi:hypothetical protein
MDIDAVLGDELLDLAPPDIRLGFIIGDDQLDRPATDPAGLVDTIDRHLQPDQRGLAAGRRPARQGLQGADPEGLGLTEGGSPRRPRQDRRAESDGARRYGALEHAAARNLAARAAFVEPVPRVTVAAHPKPP